MAWCLPACVLILLSSGFAQTPDFTLQMEPFPSPAAINPGGTTASNIMLGSNNGFSSTVDLSCQVTSAASGEVVTTPSCQMSPPSLTPPGGATANMTATDAVPGLYTVTVTGTSGGNTHSALQNLAVLAVIPNFTITVAQTIQPSSVHAGSGAQGIININPINGYVSPSGTNGGVWLSCSSITPLVTVPPICSFPNPVVVNGAGAVTATISISTIGPPPRAAAATDRLWFALWLPVPMLALAGIIGGKRSRRAWCVLALLVLAGTMLLAPACSSTTTITPTNPQGQITPKNTYTFTLMGVDTNGVSSSNTGTSATSVTLTVD